MPCTWSASSVINFCELICANIDLQLGSPEFNNHVMVLPFHSCQTLLLDLFSPSASVPLAVSAILRERIPSSSVLLASANSFL